MITLTITSLKVIITLSIFFLAYLSVLVPVCIVGMSESLFSVGNTMTSGILLAAALTHQLADSSRVLDCGYTNNNNDNGGGDDERYPMSMLIAGLTFVGFLILEESMHLIFLGEHDHDDDDDDNAAAAVDHDDRNDHAEDKKEEKGDNLKRDEDPMAIQTKERGSLRHSCSHCERKHPQTELILRHRRSSRVVVAVGQRDHNHNHHDGQHDSSSHHRQTHDHHDNEIVVNEHHPLLLYHSHTHSHHHEDDEAPRTDDGCQNRHNSDRTLRRWRSSCSEGAFSSPTSFHDEHDKRSALSSPATPTTATDPSNHKHHHHQQQRQWSRRQHHHHEEHLGQHLHGSTMASFFLLIALSVHSVIEGVGIGMTHELFDLTSITIAVLAHKFFAGYALGSTLVVSAKHHDEDDVDVDVNDSVRSEEVGGGGEGYNYERSSKGTMKDRQRHLILGFIFAFATPLGVILGNMFLQYYVLQQQNDGAYQGGDGDGGGGSRPIAIVQAMMAGTFLYVSIVEVGMKELLVCRHDEEDLAMVMGGSGRRMKLSMGVKQLEAAKLVFFLVGFLAMSALALFV